MSTTAPESLRADVVSVLKRLRPELADVRDSDRLREDLGLDSLSSMELLSDITDRHAIDIDIEQVQDVVTVGDVLRVLGKALS